jgi:hypothetical protein
MIFWILLKFLKIINNLNDLNVINNISDDLNVEIHIIRKINKLTEGRDDSIKPHNSHKELYEKLKIYNIKKTYNI